MRFEIDFDGTAKLQGTLAKLRDAGEDPRLAFEDVADYFTDQAATVFRTRGATAGGWRPLSALYRKYRRPRQIGVQKGVLRRSMTMRGARYHRRKISRTQVTVKSINPNAHLFAEGRGGQPARPLVRITRKNRREIAGILQNHLTGDL